MPKQRRKPSDRLRKRSHGIWYADFRDAEFRDVIHAYHDELGIPKGGVVSLGTDDEAEAEMKASDLQSRLLELKEQGVAAKPEDPLLRDYAQYWLDMQEGTGKRASSIKAYRERIDSWHSYLWQEVGEREPRLSDVNLERAQGYVTWRTKQPSPAGGTISNRTVRHAINTMGRLMDRARKEGKVRDNPIPDVERPKVRDQKERVFLSIDETARLIKVSREMLDDPRSRVGPYFPAAVATFALTGGRKSEVLGLTWDDVDFEAEKVRFRPNAWRDTLKSDAALRSVPLWPQLRETLEWYREETGRDSGLLFPSPMTGDVIKNMSKPRDSALDRAEVDKDVTWHTFRHTYCATRLMTPITSRQGGLFLVMKEMGHSHLDLIRDIYGHVHDSWPELERVEYRETDVTPISAARQVG